MDLTAGHILLSLVEITQSLPFFPPIVSVIFLSKLQELLLMPRNSVKSLKSTIKNTKTYNTKPLPISPPSSIHSLTNIIIRASIPTNPIYFTTTVFHNYYNAQNSLMLLTSFMGYIKSLIHKSVDVIVLTSSSPPNIYIYISS